MCIWMIIDEKLCPDEYEHRSRLTSQALYLTFAPIQVMALSSLELVGDQTRAHSLSFLWLSSAVGLRVITHYVAYVMWAPYY